MKRLVYCQKLKKESEGFLRPPIPGELGQKLYDLISIEAWQQWVAHQTLLINEKRLSVIDSQSRVFLLNEMNKFLFGEGSDKPAGYTPTKATSS